MQVRVVIIDNYDSFTYNLRYLVKEVAFSDVDIVKNDDPKVLHLDSYSHIILSPGPGIPNKAGFLKDVIVKYAGHIPILGVCLGLQAIGEVYGCSLKNLSSVYHGMKTEVHKTQVFDPILKGVPTPFLAGRYHSWVIDNRSVSDCILVTSFDNNGEIMSIKHKDLKVFGVQFHPESIITPDGKVMLKNFLNI